MLHQRLLTSIAQHTTHIGVIGLGYVGLQLAVAWARLGFSVTGIDIDSERVALCHQGKSWISDVPSHDLASVVREGHLTATTDMAALSDLDVAVICVPTPLNKMKDPDISAILLSKLLICDR